MSNTYARNKTTHFPKDALLVDVGNTSTHIVYWCHGKPKKQWRVETNNQKIRFTSAIARKFPLKKIEVVLISSVVPWASKLFTNYFDRLGLKTLVAGEDFPIPIANRYKRPQQVGADRLLNAVATVFDYQADAIIIDFGTAITFDVVSKGGAYLGGAIAPGIEISLEALFLKTALLPKVRLKPVRHVIGRNTADSIRIGCCLGIGGLCDRLVETMQKNQRSKSFVIATGGYASFMSKYCSSINKIDPLLLMKGLIISYSRFIAPRA